jgi:biotin operon repressor
MARRLASDGFPGYRRSDAVLVRLLRTGPVALGTLSEILGISRQAARKTVGGLEGRGLAVVGSDPKDGRARTVTLTPLGQQYANAVVRALTALNAEVARRVDWAALVATDAVLRAAIFDDRTASAVARIAAPDPSLPGRSLPDLAARHPSEPDPPGPGPLETDDLGSAPRTPPERA